MRQRLTLLSFIRVVALFAVILSLVSMPVPFTSVPVVRANQAPVEAFYPAGPAMDTLVTPIFVDENAEFTALQVGSIDISDWPLTPGLISTFQPSSSFFVTAPISATEYFELEFHLGSSFWGCNMSFGGSACGKDIRQGIAHLVDKNVFTSSQPDIAGVSIPVDDPVPPSVGLPAANPCGWDAAHPQSGSNCIVGATGGTAYHLLTATGVLFPWQPALGSPDFCAAADHFISAGLATGKDPTTCQLSGITSSVSSFPVNLFARSDHNPRLQLGQSVAEEMCALFTGSFTAGCSPYVTFTQGPITIFTGFQTSPTTVNQGWNMYTAGFGNVLTFDSSLFFGYDSQFVSGIPSIEPPCSTIATPSFAAPNYMYICDPTYDNQIQQAEFSPCISAAGDPTNGQVTPTFANCPSTTKLTAKSASYQAQDEFGQKALTMPWYSGRNQFGYLSNWSRVVLNKANGLTPPGANSATFNAYSATPAQTGTIRQGFKEPPTSANIFISNTVWDAGLTAGIYDAPNSVNPDSPQATLDWMTTSTAVLQNNQLAYTPAPGTVETYRYTFRNDIFWQSGQKVTAWDAAFSYIAEKSTGTPPGAGLAPMVGVKVLSPTQMDVNINNFGPFTQLFLSSTIIPARFWLPSGSQSAWDAGASNPNFAAANAALTPLIGSAVTSSGVILPTAGTSAIDGLKILPGYDPIASGTFVGSSSWVCKSSGGVVGIGCSSTGTQSVAPGGTFTLQRYGFGTTPGGSLNAYFRSSGNLALWTWSGDTGDFNRDFLNFGVVSLCFGQALLPLGTTTGCGHWQQGIGAPNGHATVGLTQVGIVQRFVGVNWVSPYNWISAPPQGIVSFAPVLYEGISTGNAGNPFAAGVSQTLNPASVAGCTSAYPTGGYDC
jgi:hypothetical protein